MQITHPRQQQIVQGNHARQLSRAVLDHRHSRQPGFRHAKNDHPQRLVRMRHHGLGHHVAAVRDHAFQSPFAIDHRIKMLAALCQLAVQPAP